MTVHTTSPTRLDAAPLSVRATLAAAWTSFMFLYIYVDYYHLYKAGTVDDLLSGVVFEFAISPALLTGFLALIAVPALMVALSATLPARVSRMTNLIVTALYVPVTIFNAVGEAWEWVAFYALSIGLELALLVVIFRAAWRWPRATSSS
ncbi:DUF6326 family protein [Microbacterium koreense]|uniref:DUF6326 family protein n=1 Tax=Microbacterium koreense TaxID=323761 RepID=A0ABW2ZNY0_9MICO